VARGVQGQKKRSTKRVGGQRDLQSSRKKKGVSGRERTERTWPTPGRAWEGGGVGLFQGPPVVERKYLQARGSASN